jgi:hypothetical protein
MSSLGAIVALLLSASATVPLPSPAATPSALPSRGLVIVLRPTDVDERTRTALARVTGELTAAHFRVTVVPLDPNIDPAHQVETVSPDSNAVAAFAIGHPTDFGPDIVAIWVCDRLGRRTTIQRMAMHGDSISKDAEALALEAIELIRVSIAGLWPNPPHAGTVEASPPPEPPPPPPVTREPFEVGIGVGFAVLRDPGLETSHWLGTLSASVLWARRLGVRLSLAGLGTAETVSGAAGDASVRHQLASIGPLWNVWTGTQVWVSLSLGVGFDHVMTQGMAVEPDRGRSDSAWVPMVDAGIAGAVALGGGISIAAEVQALAATRPLVVRIGDSETAEIARPGVLIGARLQAHF